MMQFKTFINYIHHYLDIIFVWQEAKLYRVIICSNNLLPPEGNAIQEIGSVLHEGAPPLHVQPLLVIVSFILDQMQFKLHVS